jgi:hypothetical protein
MIPRQLVDQVNAHREVFVAAVEALGKVRSLQSLEAGSERLRAELAELRRLGRSPRLSQPFTTQFACAFVGSSGHGKTSILAEMVPRLAHRQWLQTDVTDTTSQALVIRCALPDAADADEVTVHSWDLDQIRRLVVAARDANDDNNLRVRSLSDVVEIDGTDGFFAAEDRRHFRFDVKQALRPLPRPWRLSPEQRTNVGLIRALTVKEEAEKVFTGTVFQNDGLEFNVLQLRAVIKDVTLADPFDQVAAWAGRPAAELAALRFIDTPGLATSGSIKDEVLRNVLEKKSHQIILELLRQDDLDLIVHLVLCGKASDFARLWRAAEEQCGPEELADLSDRLVLAINGTNVYFTNADLKRKWSDAAAAEREGDHFAITLEDNILKKMSERGTVRPARICFLDSRRIVESMSGSYAQFYAQHRPLLESWARPGGIGFPTLERLGLRDSFQQNINALCDPADRGQGFLVRQVLDVIRATGPKLFLRRSLIRTQLLASIKRLRGLLLRSYDQAGRLTLQSIQDALRQALRFLDPRDPHSVETFARQALDDRIDQLVPGPDARPDPKKWVGDAYRGLCNLLFNAMIRNVQGSDETRTLLQNYLQELMNQWRRSWGYATAELPPPTRQQPATADLLRHCLKFHAREMLSQLLTGAVAATTKVPQDAQDQEQVRRLLDQLAQAERQAEDLCRLHGVPCP